ncbi:MAG: hypothetical protein K8U57_16005 [Planctomycetes bacterium]|nr:hypothetical protein [Planctomycetota bacterium]
MNIKSIGVLATLSSLFLSPPAAHADDIEPGLYLRMTYAFGNLSLNTIYIGTGNNIAIDPKNGIDPFDFKVAAKESSQKVGTFKIEGNKILVTWTGATKAERLDVEFEKGKFSVYDGGLVSKADAYAKNQTLEATFAGSGQTANVSSSRTLSLTSGGKYTMTQIGGVRGVPGKTGVAEKTVQGTYKLAGNTLTLTTSAGDVTKHTVMPFNTALDPKKAKLSDEHLIFDGANLKREK